MGTCCGKPTVWNDMCEDCNNRFDDEIYDVLGVDNTAERHYSADPFNPMVDSEVFSVLFDLRDVLFIEGHYIDRDQSKGGWARLMLRIAFKDKVDLFISQTNTKCDATSFISECDKIKEKFKQYRGLH